MNPSQSAPQPVKPQVLSPNQILITGRIDSVRAYEWQGRRGFEQRVVLPASDNYSAPSVVLVRSSLRLESPGDDIRALCEIHGFRSRFTAKDGEVIDSARMTLRAID